MKLCNHNKNVYVYVCMYKYGVVVDENGLHDPRLEELVDVVAIALNHIHS